MRVHRTLRIARRARRVNQVARIVRQEFASAITSAKFFPVAGGVGGKVLIRATKFPVQSVTRRRIIRRDITRGHGYLTKPDHDVGVAIIHDVANALCRVARIYRHIRGPCAENPHHNAGEPGAPARKHHDAVPRAHTPMAELPRHHIRVAIDVVVGQSQFATVVAETVNGGLLAVVVNSMVNHHIDRREVDLYRRAERPG